jgi:hypothetical protein
MLEDGQKFIIRLKSEEEQGLSQSIGEHFSEPARWRSQVTRRLLS